MRSKKFDSFVTECNSPNRKIISGKWTRLDDDAPLLQELLPDLYGQYVAFIINGVNMRGILVPGSLDHVYIGLEWVNLVNVTEISYGTLAYKSDADKYVFTPEDIDAALEILSTDEEVKSRIQFLKDNSKTSSNFKSLQEFFDTSHRLIREYIEDIIKSLNPSSFKQMIEIVRACLLRELKSGLHRFTPSFFYQKRFQYESPDSDRNVKIFKRIVKFNNKMADGLFELFKLYAKQEGGVYIFEASVVDFFCFELTDKDLELVINSSYVMENIIMKNNKDLFLMKDLMPKLRTGELEREQKIIESIDKYTDYKSIRDRLMSLTPTLFSDNKFNVSTYVDPKLPDEKFIIYKIDGIANLTLVFSNGKANLIITIDPIKPESKQYIDFCCSIKDNAIIYDLNKTIPGIKIWRWNKYDFGNAEFEFESLGIPKELLRQYLVVLNQFFKEFYQTSGDALPSEHIMQQFPEVPVTKTYRPLANTNNKKEEEQVPTQGFTAKNPTGLSNNFQ